MLKRKDTEKLQSILEQELGRTFTYEGTRRLGEEFVELYKTLAQGRIVTKGGLKNRNRLDPKEDLNHN